MIEASQFPDRPILCFIPCSYHSTSYGIYVKVRVPKNWCFWTMVLEKTLESPLDCKEIKPVNPNGNQSWMFIGRTDAEAPILWPPDAKSRKIRKDPDAGKDWRQEEKGTTEDEMVGRNHQLNGHEFAQALGDGEEQGSLACCSPWGCKELDTTEWLNNNNCISWMEKQVPLFYSLCVLRFTLQLATAPSQVHNHYDTQAIQYWGIAKLGI